MKNELFVRGLNRGMSIGIKDGGSKNGVVAKKERIPIGFTNRIGKVGPIDETMVNIFVMFLGTARDNK